jgi:hypothetical protein
MHRSFGFIDPTCIAFEVKIKAKSFNFIILMQFFETKILLFLSKYVTLFFNMIRINCTPQKSSGFNQMEEAKVSSRNGWLDTSCRIHSGVNRKRTLPSG